MEQTMSVDICRYTFQPTSNAHKHKMKNIWTHQTPKNWIHSDSIHVYLPNMNGYFLLDQV